MNATTTLEYDLPEVQQSNTIEKPIPLGNEIKNAYFDLKQGVSAALETYSNVHRGSGHNSVVTTLLFEQARNIVLEYLGLNKAKYVVVFCSLRSSEILKVQFKPNTYQSISSQDIGLPLGVRALAIEHNALPKGIPMQTGGGTASLVSANWVIWAKAPDKFEAGTPAIVNIIAFAKALTLIKQYGKYCFMDVVTEKHTADEILYHDELEKYVGKELLIELKKTLIGRNNLVPTIEGHKPFINLDNGASTRTFSPIWDAVWQSWTQTRQVQQDIIHKVKTICADALGAPSEDYETIFTSNTTEAINILAKSLQNETEQGTETVVLNSLLEHNSNELPWRTTKGLSLIRLSVDAEGFIDLNELETLLSAYNKEYLHGNKRIKLVAVSGASNVLGVFNNLLKISNIAHSFGARLFVDAAQLVAHRKVDMEMCNIDYLAFSAHKVYAPFGSGALLFRKGSLNFSPNEMDKIHSSGEENVGGIAGMGKSLVLLQRVGMDLIQEEEQLLTGYALREMAQIQGVEVYGIKNPALPSFAHKGGVIVFQIKGVMPNQVAKRLAELGGIGVRYGCHCTHLMIKRLLKVSPTLEKFQGVIVTLFPKVALPGLTRMSLGIENSKEEIDVFIRVLNKISRKSNTGNDMKSDSIDTATSIVSKKELKHQMDDYKKVVLKRVYNQTKF